MAAIGTMTAPCPERTFVDDAANGMCGCIWTPPFCNALVRAELASRFGRNYTAENYTDAWLAVTEPSGWTAESIGLLKAHCTLDDEAGCKN